MAEHWSLSQEEEDTRRRQLFHMARKGDAKAKQDLVNTYGVRLWSEQERAQLVYENVKPKRGKPKRGTEDLS